MKNSKTPARSGPGVTDVFPKHRLDLPARILVLALGLLGCLPGRISAVEVTDLPLLAPDISTYQVSSHNKQGLNGDGGYCLYDAPPDSASNSETNARRAVLFDAIGPGCVRTFWGLGEHDIWIELDGKVVVDAAQDDFFQGRIPGFPLPLVRKALVASGPWKCVSHWSFVPLGFRERCLITTRHPSPFYHVIAERYRNPALVTPWSRDQDLSALKSDWTQIGSDPKHWAGLEEVSGLASLAPGASTNLLDLNGAGAVASIRIRIPLAKDAIQSLWLVMSWDGQAKDVEAPLGFFFGAGVRWQDIPSLCFGIRGDEGYSYFPMPFWKSARIRLENRGTKSAAQIGFRVSWRSEPYAEERTGYFRAWYHEGSTTRGRDWIFLDTKGQGQYVGVVHRLIGGHYCEGDIRFYIDGSRSPAFYGTGTEDYYHQACWPNSDNHTPFHGCVGDVVAEAERAGNGKTFYDFPACYYRVHLEAPVRFCSAIRCGIEHGGVNDTDSRYASLAFWYARDPIGLVQSDAVSFSGPDVETLQNYFEGDDDDVLVRADILKTTDAVTRVLRINPANSGVRLRRVLDQSAGPQGAFVFVDDTPAGTWYDPDRNPWKRLAESDLELPPKLTRGKSSIRVRFVPREVPWTIGELRALSHLNKAK
ncbi:MAG: DUF2961 domain-containing protein [Candidatus Omnitrophica bacterium]|nr:DUF2961 domain-containing protein [Candidatus Omnitrophota bacterium]